MGEREEVVRGGSGEGGSIDRGGRGREDVKSSEEGRSLLLEIERERIESRHHRGEKSQ